MWRNRRLQTKLLSVFVGIGLLAVLVTGWQGYHSAKRALEHASFNALTAIREVKKRQIEAYFAQLRHQIVAFAENDMIIEAMQQFQVAFYQIPHDLPATNAPLADSASALHAFYRNVFLDRLMTANETLSADIQRYLPHDDITTMLQSAYIARNPHPLGEKDRLLSVEDGSAYSRVHARYHRLLQSYLSKFGYYDIFLIDATTGHVVYRVFKEVDFATNLLTGPLQETPLEQVFRAVRQAPNGFVTLVDRANPSACALLGYTESELLGLPISQVLPDTVAPAAWLEDVLQHGHIGSRETLYHVRDGHQVPLLFSSAVMRGPAEALEGIVWVAQDLQEIKALEARHQFVRDTFGRYVTEDVVASILDTPEGLRLGGETRTVTIMMSDLRGFTTLAERLTPAQVVTFLNRYLETMVEHITHYQGTIDEIIGDGILVIFGAPIARHDDALRAVACAVAMQLAMDEVNAQNRREGLPEVGMGIGIHTGEVVAGNIGSHKRTKYGVVGSAVNMTGRIESYTTGGQVLISEATRTAVASLVRVAGEITIEPKGAQAPMTIYDVGGIGSPYNLFLPRHTATLVPLATPIALRYAVLEAKHVGAVAGTGHLVQLSATQGELHTDRALAAMSDLRIRLFDTTGAEIAGDLYAKVMHTTMADARRCLVHFTAQSPEVTAFFHQALPSSIPEETVA